MESLKLWARNGEGGRGSRRPPHWCQALSCSRVGDGTLLRHPRPHGGASSAPALRRLPGHPAQTLALPLVPQPLRPRSRQRRLDHARFLPPTPPGSTPLDGQ